MKKPKTTPYASFKEELRQGSIVDERQELPGFERNAPTRQVKRSKVFKTPIQRAKEKK